MSKKKLNANCPCGSGVSFSICCEPIITGCIPPVSAEVLMRSRYTAYTQNNEQYLLGTWHDSTRPENIIFDKGIHWLRLKIIKSEHANVEFIATHQLNGKAYKLHESSRFIFENGQWFYIDGDMASSK